MRLSLAIFAILATTVLVFGEKARYDNYRIYKVHAESVSDVKVLQDLENSSDSYIFLTGPSKVKKFATIVVAPHKLADFVSVLQRNNINYELVETNLQRQIDEEALNNEKSRATRAMGWTAYYTLEDIYDWLRSLANTYAHVTTVIAGYSFEGREILGVKISYKDGNPGIFIEGGIHSREWISPAAITYILNELLTSNDQSVRNVAENYDWYIFPNTNPDGYVYSHVGDRMWRKTRKPSDISPCVGVDPNRNWDFNWNDTVGASSNPCSDAYAGPYAFSEVETLSLSQYVNSLDRIVVYISFHAFSQLLMYPFSYADVDAPNREDLQQIGDAAAASLTARHGTQYIVGDIFNTIYVASGSSLDWVYAEAGIKVAFVYELRPDANNISYMFELPADQIIPTGEETLDSLVSLIEETANLGYFNRRK